MIYKIEGKPLIDTDNEDEQANTDWEHLEEFTSKSKAKKFAKMKSSGDWYEIHVIARKDPLEDPDFDAYYQNGKLEFRMF